MSISSLKLEYKKNIHNIDIVGGSNNRQQKRKKKRNIHKRVKTGKKPINGNIITTFIKKRTIKAKILDEYKNSIYYDINNFNDITKHILDSDLLDLKSDNNNDNNNSTIINNKFDNKFIDIIKEILTKKSKVNKK
jgi:hypothetical protein